MKNKTITLLIVAVAILGGIYFFQTREGGQSKMGMNERVDGDVEIVATDLDIPWELVFLPDGDMLVTERPGTLVRIGEDKQSISVSGVHHQGEGGLLGLALHPNFSQNGWIYLYLTTQQGGTVTNRVERYTLEGATLSGRKVIIENIPGSTNHDGGRIAFGPDGYIYIATGDAGNEQSAQDTNSLAGKILRLTDDGVVPADNPFRNPAFSFGHRNVQGLTWDSQGRLWATEHGRSGIRSGFDEINLIVAGSNYGWPNSEGDEVNEGTVAPKLHSGASETWAPAGIAYANNHLLFAGLRGESLYAVSLEGDEVKNLQKYFDGEYGRLRTVVVGPDGALYILTNNRDGRGKARANDDKIIRVPLDLLK